MSNVNFVDNVTPINAQWLNDVNTYINTTGVTKAQLAAPDGAGKSGFSHAITYSPGTLGAKANESIHIKDAPYNAVRNGIADDTSAISAARAAAAQGGSVSYGGKTYSADFWGNLAPLAQEWIRGLPTIYATDMASNHPVMGGKLFNGTVLGASGLGYAAYLQRMDAYTKTGVDVASTVVSLDSMQSYSTNSSGANFNDTNQVAHVANASAMDANSSASIEASNSIVASLYSGPLPQCVIGEEVDMRTTNDAGWFGDAAKAYSVGYSAVLDALSSNATVAFIASSSSTLKAWWHGFVSNGSTKTGLTVAREGARRPETGVWVSAADAYGIYIGAKNKHQLNPGSTADYAYGPVVGIALGQTAAASGGSHPLRLTRTDAGGVEKNIDIQHGAPGNLEFQFDGTKKCEIQSFNGGYNVGGNQVIAGRDTGWGVNTGATSKAAFDPSTVTLQALAQNVAALEQALKNHGLIGT